MIYLVIMFLVAATGLASLWVQQRRDRAHLDTVDGFKDSLERLSAAPLVRARRQTSPPRRSAPARRRAPSAGHPSGRRAPLDPARRAAARKRIEARRRAATTRSRAR